MARIGKTRWAIGDGYIPAWSNGPKPEMESHESISLLNASDDDAHVRITVFFEDREPVGPYEVVVPARRTRHVRFNNLDQPQAIPRGEGFSALIESDVPLVAQHTRLDSRQSENALLSTIPYSE